MKRSFVSSCASVAALAVLLAAPNRAAAFDTSRTYEIYLINGYEKVDLGELVVTPFEYVDCNGYEACSYWAGWDAPVGVSDFSQFVFDERITPGHMDCELNGTLSFPTLIVNSPDYENSGVDPRGNGKSIENMVLSENADGSASGIIAFDENHPYPMLLEPTDHR